MKINILTLFPEIEEYYEELYRLYVDENQPLERLVILR